MNRIYLGGKIPRIWEEGRSCMLPFGSPIELKGEYRIDFPLISTKGGGASWRIDERYNSPEYLTWGHYNPVWRGVVTDPTVVWNTHQGNFRQVELRDCFIGQQYSAGYNRVVSMLGICRFAEIRPLQSKKFLAEYKLSEEPPLRQGSLEIHPLANEGLEEMEEEYTLFEGQCFLNHCLWEGKIIAKVRQGDTLYALVKFSQDGAILSPDHLWEQATISAGWYILEHPEPAGVVD